MANFGGHPINIPTSEDSEDDYSTKTKIVKLNWHNWHNWKSAFEDVIIGKGHKEILNKDWVKENATTKTYRQKNALALSLLRTSIDKDLQSCIKSSKSKFAKAYQALALECGEKSLIVVGEALIWLVNITYKPGRSLCKHTSSFKDAYVNLSEMIEGQPPEEQVMNVSTGLAAILFIKSLQLNKVMSSLISTLYNLQPFTLEAMSNRVMLEDSQRVSNSTKLSYYVGRQLKPQRQVPQNPVNHNNARQPFKLLIVTFMTPWQIVWDTVVSSVFLSLYLSVVFCFVSSPSLSSCKCHISHKLIVSMYCLKLPMQLSFLLHVYDCHSCNCLFIHGESFCSSLHTLSLPYCVSSINLVLSLLSYNNSLSALDDSTRLVNLKNPDQHSTSNSHIWSLF